MTSMKYSEFLRRVINELKEGFACDKSAMYICGTPSMYSPANEYKPHVARLKKTIRTKIDQYNKKNPSSKWSTLTYILDSNSEFYTITPRVKWLEKLVRIHESKGN